MWDGLEDGFAKKSVVSQIMRLRMKEGDFVNLWWDSLGNSGATLAESDLGTSTTFHDATVKVWRTGYHLTKFRGRKADSE